MGKRCRGGDAGLQTAVVIRGVKLGRAQVVEGGTDEAEGEAGE